MKSIQQAITIKTKSEIDVSHLVYLPDDYSNNSSKLWPVIFYLHGMGERGSDCTILKNEGLPKYVEGNPIPFIVVAPQCPKNSEWIFHLEALVQFIKNISEQYRIDTKRTYLTGNSMGGIGAWHLGIKNPNLFAAIIPICGGVYPFLGYPEAVVSLKDTPIWNFHGMNDDVIPVHLSQVLVDTLLKEHGKIEYTYYENVGHDSWTMTYANKEIYTWMLSKTKQ